MMTRDHRTYRTPVELLEPRRLLCSYHEQPEITYAASSASDAASQLAWTGVGRLPLAREEGASASMNGKLYVMGGFFNDRFDATTRVDVFDPATNRWTRAADMPLPITHAATVTTATRIWVIGGYIGTDPGPATAAIFIYNPQTNKWTRGPDMPAPRGAHAAALVGSNLYVFGGRNKARTAEMQTSYVLNIDTNEWRTIARMPDPRNHLSGAQVDGQVYAIGGQKDEATRSVNLNVVHRYNPKRDRWFPAPNLPSVQSHTLASTYVFDRKIITVGGESQHNLSTSNTYVFDPYANRWSTATNLPVARRAPQGALIANQIFVAGGSTVGAQRDEMYRSNNLNGVI